MVMKKPLFTPERAKLIKELCAAQFQVTVAQLEEKGRSGNIPLARQTAMFLIREALEETIPFTKPLQRTPVTHSTLKRSFNMLHHSTAAHGCRKVRDLLSVDRRYRATVDSLRTQIKAMNLHLVGA